MGTYIIIIFALGHVFNAIMDVLQFRHDVSIFKDLPEDHFFGSRSWVRKYKKGFIKPVWKNWYYKTFNVVYMERFPLSATALVFLTDGWHFSQWMMFNCYSLAISLALPYHWLYSFVIIRVLAGLLFNLMYNKILRKNG